MSAAATAAMSTEILKHFPFDAYITNLGKYNEGYLVGEWVHFPTTPEEMQDVFKRIGIGQKDDFGQPYEEWFITDYDCYVPGLYDVLGEYESLDELNYLASRIEEMSDGEFECFQAAVEMGEYTGSVKDLINLTENLDCYNFYSDIHSDEDLGYYWAEESGAYDASALGTLSNYIDYEAFGRDIRFDEGGTFTDNGYIINNYSNFIEQYSGDREEIPDEYRVFVSEDEPTLETMTEDEKQAFVDGIELSLDYQLTEGITQSDMDLYNAIIQERAEHEKPSIRQQLAENKAKCAAAPQENTKIKNNDLEV